MAVRGAHIETEGLQKFRRDLKRFHPELDKQVKKEAREVAGNVAEEAAATAPRVTGKLARDYRPYVTMKGAGIRNREPYAGWIEHGGTIRPKGVDITIRGREPITRAVEHQTTRIVEGFGDAVERAADATGWRPSRL